MEPTVTHKKIHVVIERGTSESEPPALPTTPAAQSVNTLFVVDRRTVRSRGEKSRKYQIFSIDKNVCYVTSSEIELVYLFLNKCIMSNERNEINNWDTLRKTV